MSEITLDENTITIMLMDASYGVTICEKKNEQAQEITQIAGILERRLPKNYSREKLEQGVWNWYNELLKNNKIKLLVPQAASNIENTIQ